ncbi:MAG TPA: type IV pilin protein, partial [Thermoleophilaceae bacterium]|nr:type IV pilin protein [Thermoleophilaceae bacterium]
GQRQKGQDSSAKSNVRNVVSALESCYTQNETYVGCDTSDDITKSGIKIGTAKNEVALTTLEANTFAVTAKSESDHTFMITKGVDGTSARSCTVAGKGGCKTGSVW